MFRFKSIGPFPIPFEKRKGGRLLNFDGFWDRSDTSPHADDCGCYVFAIRAGKGLTPIYVGKATKTFRQEAFNPSNRHKYHNGFANYAKGTPLLYLIKHPTQAGPIAKNKISELEDFLIQNAVAQNPDLQNVHGTGTHNWGIVGIIRGGKGGNGQAAHDLKLLLDIS